MIKISDTIRVVPGYRRDIPERHVPITRQLAVVPTAMTLSEDLVSEAPRDYDRFSHMPTDRDCILSDTVNGGCLEAETEDGCPLFDRACTLYGEPVSNIRWVRIGASSDRTETELTTEDDMVFDPYTVDEVLNDPEYEEWCQGFRV